MYNISLAATEYSSVAFFELAWGKIHNYSIATKYVVMEMMGVAKLVTTTHRTCVSDFTARKCLSDFTVRICL